MTDYVEVCLHFSVQSGLTYHLRLPDFNLCNQINQGFSWGYTLHRIYNKNVSVYLYF